MNAVKYHAAQVERFGDASGLSIALRDIQQPIGDELLIEVHAASVTPLDTYLRNGIKVGNYTPTLPYTPGAALSGIVSAMGSDAGRFKLGDRVYGRAFSGSNAEFALCKSSQVFALPPRVGFTEGALVPVPYETAYYGLVDLADGKGGDVVLVQGAAGAVGAASVQFAISLGMTVFATCARHDMDKVRENGAQNVFDYKDPTYPDQILTLTDGRGVDMIMEVSARANLTLDMGLAAAGARIIIVGGTGDTPFNALPVIAKGLKILGVDLKAMAPRRAAQVNAVIVAGLQSGVLRPAAAHHFSLDAIAEAHAAVESGRASGGVVLKIRSNEG